MALNNLFKKNGGNQNPEPYDSGYDNDYYDNFANDSYAPAGAQDNNTANMGGYTQQEAYAQPAPAGMSIGGNNGIDVKVVVVKPEKYDSVPQIADHLLNKRSVVLNLESTNKETARRLIDFLTGVAYSIDGNLRKISNNTYFIAPSNIEVSGENLRDRKPAREEPDEDTDTDPFSDIG